MAQFPLALSIEPRLLPLAIANGLRMDSRVRIYRCPIVLSPFNGNSSTAILCFAESFSERTSTA
jgi:hypothetical protein